MQSYEELEAKVKNLEKEIQVLKESSGVLNAEQFQSSLNNFSQIKDLKNNLSHTVHLLQKIINHSSALIYAFDREGKCILLNQNLADLCNITTEFAIGKRREEWLPESNAMNHFQNDIQIFESGKLMSFEEELKLSDGLHTFLTEKFPLQDESGKIYAVAGISTDITKQKKAEKELYEKHQLLDAIFQSAPMALLCLDREGNISMWAPSAERMFGWKPDEVLGKFNPIVPSSEKEYFLKSHDFVLQGNSLPAREMKRLRADGSLVETFISVSPLKDVNGNILGAIGMCNDITDRKTLEIALKESEKKLRTVFDVLDVGITITNSDGQIIDCNKASEKILGISKEEHLSRNYASQDWKILRPDMTPMPAAEYSFMPKENDKKSISNLEMGVLKPNGEISWLLVNVIPLDLPKLGVAISYVDITEAKAAEIALQESEKKLKESNIAKDKFFSIVAHDLRSPISSIDSAIDILLDIESDFSYEEIRDFLIKLKEASQSTLGLLENLLTWARSQRGDVPFSPAKTNLNQIIQMNIELFRTAAEAKKVYLSTELKKDFYSFFDKNLIDTVIRNLINNALKYTRENDLIVISVTEVDNKIFVSIKDTGIGMDQSTREKLFRIDVKHYSQEGTRGEKGSGLGLILCREFIERHGEKIWAESEFGKGSEFLFTLPLI